MGKSTSSGFKTGLDIINHGGNAVRYIEERDYFMKDARISCYFDTKCLTVLRIDQILDNFEDQIFANFFNLEQVKDGSWNPRVFAHLSGQIFADIQTCPYCFVCEEPIQG